MILLRRRRDDQRVNASRRERDGADKAGRAAADYGSFDGLDVRRTVHEFLVVHQGNL